MSLHFNVNRTRSFKVVLSLLAWCLLFFLNPEGRTLSQEKKEGWIPDYNKRDKWQQPKQILDALGIKPGMVIADVGSGTGYLTLRLANRVGEKGIVYASDIRKDRIQKLKDRAHKSGFKNIIAIHGNEKDPGLPKVKFDMVIMLHVIHIVIKKHDPLALLANIKPALKPGGILVLVHWDGKKMGYPEVEAYSKENVMKVMKEAGFILTRTETFLPRDNIFILKSD